MNQLIEIQYFGCICFYVSAVMETHVTFEQFETYQKMSYRNRCQILGANKVIDLSVPLIGGRDQKGMIANIGIDNNQTWQVQHWRTIESCYNKSAFFLHYKEDFKLLLFQQFDYLLQLNIATIQWVLGKLKATVAVDFTHRFQKVPENNQLDLRNKFKPSNRHRWPLTPYQQVFEQPFEPNLCILDLLFNMGPQALNYLLRQDITTEKF